LKVKKEDKMDAIEKGKVDKKGNKGGRGRRKGGAAQAS